MLKIEKKLIGIRIMQKRKEHELSQEQLAEKIGFSKNHLSNIERGQYTPTLKFVLEICNVLGETPDYYLLGKISETSDNISDTIKRLPEDRQHLVLKLLETYLDEINNS